MIWTFFISLLSVFVVLLYSLFPGWPEWGRLAWDFCGKWYDIQALVTTSLDFNTYKRYFFYKAQLLLRFWWCVSILGKIHISNLCTSQMIPYEVSGLHLLRPIGMTSRDLLTTLIRVSYDFHS